MRPNRYPYSGQMKKQPHDEIAKLRCELNVLKTDLTTLVRCYSKVK